MGSCVRSMQVNERRHAQREQCCNNLRMIGLDFKIWAGDHNDEFPMRVSVANGGTLELISGGAVYPHYQILSNILKDPRILICPTDTQEKPARDFTTNFSDRNISYFVGISASQKFPDLLLGGDRNITNGHSPVNGILEIKANQPVGWTGEFHRGFGDVVFADGSSSPLNQSLLREALSLSNSNRLAIP